MIVQIYEIQSPYEAERCILLGVDRLGSVLLSEEEWKQPAIREVVRLSEGAKIQNSLIPLFQTRDTLYRAMDYYRPHFIHFCESLTGSAGQVLDLTSLIGLQREFKEKFPEIQIVRTLPVPEQEGKTDFPVLDLARSFEPVTDAFLIDTWLGKEPVKGFIGITGKLADREAARKLVLATSIPVILAGGLSPDNVREAVIHVIPAGADSCTQTNKTGPEGGPLRFQKDFEKVDRFVREVRDGESELRQVRQKVEENVRSLKLRLDDREAALPAHSVRPHQIQIIEELEENLASAERELRALRRI